MNIGTRTDGRSGPAAAGGAGGTARSADSPAPLPGQHTTRLGRKLDFRARNHPAWWAFLVHRLSGLALAFFLPAHFWALGTALNGAARFESFLAVTRSPGFVFAEWGLVTLLAAHLIGGVRLLLIEFRPWSGLRKDLIALTAGGAFVIGMAFALSLTL